MELDTKRSRSRGDEGPAPKTTVGDSGLFHGDDTTSPYEWEPPRIEPVNLALLITEPPPKVDYLVDPVLPAGQLVGLVSSRGVGKSLIALDIAIALATGQAVLNQPAGDPISVLYIDLEMGRRTLYERLETFGFTRPDPNDPDFAQQAHRIGLLAKHLLYIQLPDMAPLDTPEGGSEFAALLDRFDPQLVILDTVGAACAGAENDNDTARNLFAYTEAHLKRRDITYLRLDHLGKDKGRGSRGGSAKEDRLDVIWQLEETGRPDTFTMKCTKDRPGLIGTGTSREITRNDELDGTLSHFVPVDMAPDWLTNAADRLDSEGWPLDAGQNATQKKLTELGVGVKRTRIRQVIEFRQNRGVHNVTKVVPKAGNHPHDGTGSQTAGTTPEPLPLETPKNSTTTGPNGGSHPTGTTWEPVKPVGGSGFPPSLEGTGTPGDLENDLPDPF